MDIDDEFEQEERDWHEFLEGLEEEEEDFALAQDDEGNEGVWRTIRGRKVFIRVGELAIDALNRSLEKTGERVTDPKTRVEARRWLKQQTGVTLMIDKKIGDAGAVAFAKDFKGQLDNLESRFGLKRNNRTNSSPDAPGQEFGAKTRLSYDGGVKRFQLLASVESVKKYDMKETNRGLYSGRESAIYLMAHKVSIDPSYIPKAMSNQWSVTGGNSSAVLAHELGHAFECQVLRKAGSQAQRQFVDMYSRGLANTVSHYAQTNVREFFAESFAVYTNPKYDGSLNKEVHEFFKKILPSKG